MIANPFPDARILVVDDQRANVLLLRRVLEQAGYQNVLGTTDPADVVGLCRESEPDLVILDLQMPLLDGFQLLELLAPWVAGAPAMRVLVATADVTNEISERALAAGARDYIQKPFDNREVELRVATLLQARKTDWGRPRRAGIPDGLAGARQRDDDVAISKTTVRPGSESRTTQEEPLLSDAERLRVAAHDFNTILGVINGYAALLLASLSTTPEAGDIEAIIDAVRRGVALTRELARVGRQAPMHGDSAAEGASR
jgi:CheY-like chemotaxis protein